MNELISRLPPAVAKSDPKEKKRKKIVDSRCGNEKKRRKLKLFNYISSNEMIMTLIESYDFSCNVFLMFVDIR